MTGAALAAAVATVALGCGPADFSRGGAAPAAPPARDIAFSFAGGIYAMRADGSRRLRLTGGSADGEPGDDSEPAWSPDGRTLAFVRTEPPSETSRSQIYLLERGGGRPRRLDTAGDAVSPAWSPDGRQIAFVRRTDSERALMVAQVDGRAERVLRREPYDPERSVLLGAPAWSPDGTLIAYTRTTRDRQSLYVVGAGGGGARLLARDAGGAAWSPDGRRIAFASVRDRNGKRCFEECQPMAELYVMDADGTDLVRLTRNRGSDHAPSWSPDGRRIVFASDRNYPQVGNSELYSIRPDGSCLAWLTNGTPESADPAWRQGPRTESRPGSCGARPRRPRLATDTRELRRVGRPPVYWLGGRYRGLLLTHADVVPDGPSSRSVFLHYDDCGRFHPRDCPRPLQLQEVSVCSRPGGSTLGVVNEPEWGRHARAFAARGLLIVDIGDGLGVVVGATHVRLFAEIGGVRGRRQLLNAVRDLRRFGKPKAPLPAPAIPRAMLRTLARTERAYDRFGSIDAVARRLGTPRQLVDLRLRFARVVRSLPRVRAIGCERN